MKQGDTGTAFPGITVDDDGVGKDLESPVSGCICDKGEGGAGFRMRVVADVVERGKYGLVGDSLF